MVVGPVQVLEDEDERPFVRQALEEAAPGGERLVTGVAGGLRTGGKPDERPEVRLDPGVGDGVRELAGRLCLVVAVEDSGLRLDHLAERPEGDALSVRQTAPVPPGDQVRVALDRAVQLEDEPALPDPGHTDERDELRRALAQRARERILEQRDFAGATDERGAVDAVDPDPRTCLYDLPRLHRLRLPLRDHRLRLAVLDRALRRPVRLFPDEDSVHRRGRLEPCGGVDHIARRHRLSRLRPGVDGDERLTGVDPDSHLDALVGRPLADRERRTDRTLRVVLVRDRRTEDRHRRVADELLHGAAVAFELRTYAGVVAAELGGDVLRVELLRARGEADQIGEQDRDDLPLPAGLDHAVESRHPDPPMERRARYITIRMLTAMPIVFQGLRRSRRLTSHARPRSPSRASERAAPRSADRRA